MTTDDYHGCYCCGAVSADSEWGERREWVWILAFVATPALVHPSLFIIYLPDLRLSSQSLLIITDFDVFIYSHSRMIFPVLIFTSSYLLTSFIKSSKEYSRIIS